MNIRIKKWSFDITLLQALLIYLFAALILLPHFRYQLNPDGISYIGIAQKYRSLDFRDAVNGYWGPLFSWLMIPFMAAGLSPLLSADLLLILTGFFVVILSDSLLKEIDVLPWLRTLFLDIIAIQVVYFVYKAISPDLLFVLLILLFLSGILKGSFRTKKSAGIMPGIIGTGLYLTKSFGFPYFIAIFFVAAFMDYINCENRKERSGIIQNYFSGMMVFLLLSGIWMTTLSVKCGHLTIGTAGSFNRSMSVSGFVHPLDRNGLTEPPNSSATCIWEDVSVLKLEKWGIFDSADTLIREMKLFIRNTYDIATYLTENSVLSIPLILIIGWILIRKGKKALSDRMTLLMITILILFFGYAMIIVDPRYIWLSTIIVLICSARLLSVFYTEMRFRWFYIIAALIISISYLIHPVSSLSNSLDNGRSVYDLSCNLKQFQIKGRVASDSNQEETLYLSFYNGWQYFGKKGDLDDKNFENELVRKDIDFFLVWNPGNGTCRFFSKYPEITRGAFSNLKVYKLKP